MDERPRHRQHFGHLFARPADGSVSVMRRYLESGIDFEWPPDAGVVNGKHCHLNPRTGIPLDYQGRISDKNASIDIYRGGDSYAFRELFVVKTIRHATYVRSQAKARSEVDNMRGLRHPHVAALLGTFTYTDRLSILIFPAACCDLYLYMKRMSEEITDQLNLQSDLVEQASSDGRQSLDSTRSSGQSPQEPRGRSVELPNNVQPKYQDPWPLEDPLSEKKKSLQRYFVCLSQALAYIHASDVRHKDIKPANILIDSSGSVILTDFGISRRFPKKAPHVTNDKWEWTRKYASPEIMKSKKEPRDDPSDVFSLGCVFLEMATLVLGKRLSSLHKHCTTTVNDSGKEDSYWYNLESALSWVDELKELCGSESRPKNVRIDEVIEGNDSIPDPKPQMVEALATIYQMLDKDPHNRPKAEELWTSFQSVSPEKCRDCDPRHPDVWRPPGVHKQESDSSIRRRSMPSILEDASISALGSGSSAVRSTDHLPMRRRSHTPPPSRTAMGVKPRSSSPMAGRKGATMPGQPVLPGPSSLRSVQNANDQEQTATKKKPTSPRVSFQETSPSSPTPVPSSTSSPSQSQHHIGNQDSWPITPDPPSSTPRQHMDGLGLMNMGSSQPSQIQATLSVGQEGALKTVPASRGEHLRRQGNQDMGHYELPSAKKIIIYDHETAETYVTAFGHLKGVRTRGATYCSYPIPKLKRRVEIGEKGKIIARVDLRPLGFAVKIRRLLGDFPRIWVVGVPTPGPG